MFTACGTDYGLDELASARLRTDALALTESGVRPGEPEFYDRHWLDVELLPIGLRDFLQRFRMTESRAACVIRGLPVDDAELGATPPHWNVPHFLNRGKLQETILALCALSVGDPFASAHVQDGRMVQNILPCGEERRDLHTVTDPHCDYLLLLAMRSARLTIASVRDLDLDGKTREILAQRRFAFEWGWAPVLFGDRSDPYLRYDRCTPTDPDAARALDALTAELDRVHRDLVVEAGSLLVIDNYRAAHGRRGDGWLKRITVSRNLRRRPAGVTHPRIL